MARILITGALGHIGSRLIHALVPGEFERVVLFDNLKTQRYCSLFNLPRGVPFEFVEADVCTDDLEPLFDGIDAVIHLAAVTNAAGSFEIQEEVERVNFAGTERVARACAKRGCRLIALSTTSVYGVSEGSVDEDCPDEQLKPQSPYAQSKLRAERLLSHVGAAAGLRFVTCRFGTIYGTSIGMRFHTAVNKFVWQACLGRPVSVWRTALDQQRPYLDLGDAVRALRFILDTDRFDNAVYNVVTENATVRQIVDTIRRFVPDVGVALVDSRIMNQLSYTVRCERFRRLGFEFQGNLQRGIADTVALLRGPLCRGSRVEGRESRVKNRPALDPRPSTLDSMPECLICRNPIEPFHRFGRMPIANGFLAREQFTDEFFFDLQVGYCTLCDMVQLTELVEPDRLFHADYAYFSSISVRMAEHFRRFANWAHNEYVAADDPLVVEVGSNDGILLRNFASAGVPHVGIEPSENVAAAAREIGVNTLCRFFDEETAGRIREQYGPADVVLGANVICHIPDLHTIAGAVNHLLKPNGVFIFEEPYLGDIVAKTSYDQIYDEHVFYFSLHSLRSLFERHDMEVIDALPQSVHGGSMRWVVARKGVRTVGPAVSALWEQEQQQGLARAETMTSFSRRIDESRDRLVALLRDLKRQNKRVAAYGATSKSTTVTNFCSIGPDLIEFICDTTPGKQGKFSPGVHIPVVPYERFVDDYPDDVLLFAWNHAAEIVEKEQAFRDCGGRFIVYVPEVGILA